MTSDYRQAEITFWSRAGLSRDDAALAQPQAGPAAEMRFEPDGRFYAGCLSVPAAGTLVLALTCPRPLRLWIGGALALDESLFWRCYEREIRAAISIPCAAGEISLLAEVGPRSGWSEDIDQHCPSRNREKVREELKRRLPDRLNLRAAVAPGVTGAAVALRFMPSQFVRDGVTRQLVSARPISGFTPDAPSLYIWSPVEMPEPPLMLASDVLPGHAEEVTSEEERKRGLRRFYVPVANALDAPPPLREVGTPETRIEPTIEVARTLALTVAGAQGSVTVDFPAFESLGHQAPVREFRKLARPQFADLRAALPEPVLPPRLAWMERIYWYTWEMLCNLIREPKPESGLPNLYVATAANGFLEHQFVWDSSFTAMCTAYAWRAFPATATLDLLYSRQFDGGYLHREHDVRDGVPAAYEPDFSPNPPITSVAEWILAALTGDRLRIAKVYPLLAAQHRWLQMNRRLPDGTYWTTGLANGLDNSPSLGDGYPCLTAQMAHDAEILGRMAHLLDRADEAAAWEAEHAAIGQALNAKLWSDSQQIYATSLSEGGHNPNKVVTAFWPLWAGVVPPERVENLKRHLLDPNSFWRHHPIPSLAADSPHFRPGGDYWLGSTWAPTNYAAIKGFARAGCRDVAFAAALRHIQCMSDVLAATGHIWENYCSEKSERGSCSGPDYCWSALGPIAMLLEIILGFEPDALHNTLRWTPPPDEEIVGIRRLALGAATVSAECRRGADGTHHVDVQTDRPFTLEIDLGGCRIRRDCPFGSTQFDVPAPVANA
jgi:hypothetical protein